MLRFQRIFKNYAETGSFNELVNLYGFVDSCVFLTKTGDLGVVLEVRGVDYECLDGNTLDGLTKRLESALRLFGENYRISQYLFKRNNERIPYKLYDRPVVDIAIKNRLTYFAGKADTLYSLSIYYVILFEGFRYTRTLGRALLEFLIHPTTALSELQARFSVRKQVFLLDCEITKGQASLLQKVESFITQISDFLPVCLLDKQEAFRILKKTLNFATEKIESARLKHDTFLDYYLCESHLECHRRHLRVDDYYVRVLTLKEPSAQSFPLIFKGLLEVQTNYYVVTEWTKEDSGDLAKLGPHRESAAKKKEIAERHGLQVVRGKIPLPDLRIEYETCSGEMARVDLELATEHYRGRNLADKVRAGFSIYAHAQGAAGLRRVLDQRELTAEILSL